MRFIPNTEEQKKEMLKDIGVSSFEELIEYIPQQIRLREDLKLQNALSEQEISENIKDLSNKNHDFSHSKSLLGCGAYYHYTPEAVRSVVTRSEFYTAYTPYQSELSQGTLQTMFEVQTHFANLTGMDAVIPSLYDGASATAEAVLMSMRLTGKNKVLISELVHPHYLETIKTYTEPHKTNIRIIPHKNFLTDAETLQKIIDSDTASVVIQSPNFVGGIENIASLAEVTHKKNSLFIQTVVESLSLAVLKSPGSMKVDIVSGEGQSFGIDLNFGGPYNGFLATKMEFARQLPGRIVGETVDKENRRAFVMTLRAREQDIRREKATSNVCSNHNLNLFAINAFLSLYGKEGLPELAERNIKASHYLFNNLVETGMFEEFRYPFFNEFILKVKNNSIYTIRDKLKKNGFMPPAKASDFFPCLEGYLIFAVTEVLSKKDLDFITEIVRS